METIISGHDINVKVSLINPGTKINTYEPYYIHNVTKICITESIYIIYCDENIITYPISNVVSLEVL